VPDRPRWRLEYLSLDEPVSFTLSKLLGDPPSLKTYAAPLSVTM
jgi:hypothetical protein